MCVKEFGARGWVIVGTHHLCVRPFVEPYALYDLVRSCLRESFSFSPNFTNNHYWLQTPTILAFLSCIQFVIIKALYPLFLYVAIKFRLSLHSLRMSGIRGQIIVGTHCLVVRPSRKLKPFLAWYGIVSWRVSPFNPITRLCY